MEKEPFNILVPFEGKMVVAHVNEVDHPVLAVYNVELPGFKTEIVAYDDEFTWDYKVIEEGVLEVSRIEATIDDSGYVEAKGGKTEFALAAGKAIESYQKDGYQPFKMEVDGEEYVILGCNNTTVGEESFSIYHDGGKLFVLHMSDEGSWEINEEASDPVGSFDEAFIHQLGYAIQSKTQ